MVARYEQMRGAALDPGNGLVSQPGFALLLRQGMTAWIRAWSNCVSPPASASGRERIPTQTSSSLPADLEAQLAMILAGMILCQYREIAT